MATITPAPILDLRNGDEVTAQAIGALPSELSDRSDSNPAVVLIEALGSVFDKYIYQLNQFPSAVIQKVLSLCGVTLVPAAGATVSQSFTLSAPQSSDTVIAQDTQVSLSDGSIIFSTLSDLTIPAYTTLTGTATFTSGSATVAAVTGTPFTTGTTWVGWQIRNVNASSWYTIASVESTTSLTLTTSATATVTAASIQVGPVTGSVQAQATTTGSDTNVGAAKLTTLVSSPSGVSTTTNGAAATGGTDEETTTAAITRAPSVFATRDVVCAAEDYETAAVAILGPGGRAKAKAGYNNTVATSGFTTIAMLSPSWTTTAPVSTLERAAVVRDLNSRTFTGATTTDIPATITSYTVSAAIYRKSSYDENTVRTNVAAALNSYLNPNTYPWGRSIYITDLVRVIEAASGVDRVEEINGVSCVSAGAQTTTANAVTFTNGSTSATGTAGNFTNMTAGQTFLIDATNKKVYLVTAKSGGTLTIVDSSGSGFTGATVSTTVAWFTVADTTYSSSTAWMTLPYSALATTVSSPPATILSVGSV